MQAEFSKKDLMRLERNMNEMMKVTRKELPKVLTATARDFIFIAIKETPKAKKIKILPLYRNGKKIVNRSGRTIYVRMKQARYPKGTGFAKGCWVKALTGLKVVPRMTWHLRSKKEAIRNGSFVNRLKALEPSYLATNACPYIEDLNSKSRFLDKSLNETMNKMERTLTRLAIKASKAWGR